MKRGDLLPAPICRKRTSPRCEAAAACARIDDQFAAKHRPASPGLLCIRTNGLICSLNISGSRTNAFLTDAIRPPRGTIRVPCRRAARLVAVGASLPGRIIISSVIPTGLGTPWKAMPNLPRQQGGHPIINSLALE